MIGVTNLMFILAAIGSTKAARGLYPQPEGATSCSVGGFDLAIGETITPTDGPRICTKISCFRNPEKSDVHADSNNSQDNADKDEDKLYGELLTCTKLFEKSFPVDDEKELERRVKASQEPYPKCCLPGGNENHESDENK